MIHLYEVLGVAKFRDGGWNNGCQWLREVGGMLFNRDRVSVWDAEKVLEIDSGDVCASECP